MKSLVFFLIVAFPILALAQPGVESQAPMLLTDFRGMPVPIHTNYNTEGSPFLMPDYCRANIKVQKGKLYTNILAKFNLQDNTIYFKFENQAEMVATVPIEYVEFSGCATNGRFKTIRAGFPAVENNAVSTYYEVLSDGPVKLLKYITINYQEQTPYNSTAVIRIYKQVPQYYVYSDNAGMVKLKDAENALLVLSAHKEEARKFISDQNIRFKKEDDLVKLINYYNTL